jgi:hypothetical protein
MNRRDIVVCLLWPVALLGRVHARQTGKVYHVAVIGPAEPSDMSEASHSSVNFAGWAMSRGRTSSSNGISAGVSPRSIATLLAMWFVAIQTLFTRSVPTYCSR